MQHRHRRSRYLPAASSYTGHLGEAHYYEHPDQEQLRREQAARIRQQPPDDRECGMLSPFPSEHLTNHTSPSSLLPSATLTSDDGSPGSQGCLGAVQVNHATSGSDEWLALESLSDSVVTDSTNSTALIKGGIRTDDDIDLLTSFQFDMVSNFDAPFMPHEPDRPTTPRPTGSLAVPESGLDSFISWPAAETLVSSDNPHSCGLERARDLMESKQACGAEESDRRTSECSTHVEAQAIDYHPGIRTDAGSTGRSVDDDENAALENAGATNLSAADLYGLPNLIARKVGNDVGREILAILNPLKQALSNSGGSHHHTPSSSLEDESSNGFATGAQFDSCLTRPWWIHEDEETIRGWTKGQFLRHRHSLCQMFGYEKYLTHIVIQHVAMSFVRKSAPPPSFIQLHACNIWTIAWAHSSYAGA